MAYFLCAEMEKEGEKKKKKINIISAINNMPDNVA